MSDNENTVAVNPEAAASEAPQQQFVMQRIYVKDISFEAPQGAEAFKKQWQPAIKQDINTASTKLDEKNHEVVLTLTVTAEIDEETVFLIEIKQAGIFFIDGLEGVQLAQTLGAVCPNILFPYAREAIDSMAVRGSFPPVQLPPINFDGLFQQAVAQRAAQAQAQAEAQAAPEQ